MSFLNAPPTGLRGLGGLQRLGRSLMLPIAALPAAGLLLRLGQDDLLGRFSALEDVAAVIAAAGNALFANLPLIFAVGIAIGWAKKADGSTALAAVVGYLVLSNVFEAMSPIVLQLTQGIADPVQADALWWSLAIGADFGGNLTAIGASANVVVLGIAMRSGAPISFWEFTRKGAIVTVVTILLAAPYLWLRYFVLRG